MIKQTETENKPTWEQLCGIAVQTGTIYANSIINAKPDILQDYILNCAKNNYHWVLSDHRRSKQIRNVLINALISANIDGVTRNELNMLISIAADAANNTIKSRQQQLLYAKGETYMPKQSTPRDFEELIAVLDKSTSYDRPGLHISGNDKLEQHIRDALDSLGYEKMELCPMSLRSPITFTENEWEDAKKFALGQPTIADEIEIVKSESYVFEGRTSHSIQDYLYNVCVLDRLDNDYMTIGDIITNTLAERYNISLKNIDIMSEIIDHGFLIYNMSWTPDATTREQIGDLALATAKELYDPICSDPSLPDSITLYGKTYNQPEFDASTLQWHFKIDDRDITLTKVEMDVLKTWIETMKHLEIARAVIYDYMEGPATAEEKEYIQKNMQQVEQTVANNIDDYQTNMIEYAIDNGVGYEYYMEEDLSQMISEELSKSAEVKI